MIVRHFNQNFIDIYYDFHHTLPDIVLKDADKEDWKVCNFFLHSLFFIFWYLIFSLLFIVIAQPDINVDICTDHATVYKVRVYYVAYLNGCIVDH